MANNFDETYKSLQIKNKVEKSFSQIFWKNFYKKLKLTKASKNYIIL